MAESTPITPAHGLKAPSRRSFIALPIAGAATFLPTLPSAATEDPVLAVYRQWLDARRDWHAASRAEQAALDAEEREDTAFRMMLDTTPVSLAGMAALLHVLWDIEGPSVAPDHEDYLEQANTQSCRLLASLWRASSGCSGLPPSCKS